MVKNSIIIFFIFFNIHTLNAEDTFLTKQVSANFSQTWHSLYTEVKSAGYTTTYLQRCDFALKERKYDSDKYRILFFGEYENMHYLSHKYPLLIPYLPLKMVVVEDGKQSTTLVANPPNMLLEVVKNQVDKKIIQKWQQDMQKIMQNIQNRYQFKNSQ
jgi:uncharacterized protein (DUF302 family)